MEKKNSVVWAKLKWSEEKRFLVERGGGGWHKDKYPESRATMILLNLEGVVRQNVFVHLALTLCNLRSTCFLISPSFALLFYYQNPSYKMLCAWIEVEHETELSVNKNNSATNLNEKWSETIQEIHNWNNKRKGWEAFQNFPYLEAHSAGELGKLSEKKGMGGLPTQLQGKFTGLEPGMPSLSR